jgi:hypothetical protein
MMFQIRRYGRLGSAGSSAAAMPQQSGGSAAVAQPKARRVPLTDDVVQARSAACQACPSLVDGFCTHPGCPSCVRLQALSRPWVTLRRCPASRW